MHAVAEVECNFPSIAIHSGLQQEDTWLERCAATVIFSAGRISDVRNLYRTEDRIARYKQFKEFQKRIMVP